MDPVRIKQVGAPTAAMPPLERHPLISWRAIVAGLLLALFTYIVFIALGVGVGGITLVDGIAADASSAAYWTAGWIVVGTALSLFIGAYFAARVARSPARIVGGGQALVLASLFFGVMLLQAATTIGGTARSLSALLGSAASNAVSLVEAAADSPQVADAIEFAIGDQVFRIPPTEVVRGVAIRVIQGDLDRASAYLARQANISETEAEARIEMARAEVEAILSEAGETTARALAAAGWALFAVMVIGSLAALGGGVLGSRVNVKRPIVEVAGPPASRAA